MPLIAHTDSADAEKGDYGKDLVVTGVRDVPDAAAALTANIANVEISPEENKRLLRKIGESLRVFAVFFVLTSLRTFPQTSIYSRYSAAFTSFNFSIRRCEKREPGFVDCE
jgi:hypothetical protein